MGFAVGVPVEVGAREPVVRVPRVARRHRDDFGRVTGAARRVVRGSDLARRDDEPVEVAVLGVQERDHAPERHAVAGRQVAHAPAEVVEIRVAGQQLEVRRVFGGVRDRVALRERVALEHEGRVPEGLDDALERSPTDLAVVDVDEDVVAVGDHERGVVEAVLERRDAHAAAELGDLAVRQLRDAPEPEPAHLALHHVDPEARDEHVHTPVHLAHRRVVEVIEVVVRQVDVVGVEPLRLHVGARREVPPRAPVARPDQPGVDEDRARARLDEETAVPDDGEAHQTTGLSGFPGARSRPSRVRPGT